MSLAALCLAALIALPCSVDVDPSGDDTECRPDAPLWEAPPAPPPAAPPPATPPVITRERARYEITYGLLGRVGEVTMETVRERSATAETVRSHGSGRGAWLGFGAMEKTLESEFDPRLGHARRWTIVRRTSGKTVVDIAVQAERGRVALLRKRPDEPGRGDDAREMVNARPLLDPGSFLADLRAAPPQTRREYLVLDGRALWNIVVEPAVAAPLPGSATRPTLRLTGEAQPLNWDGQPETGTDRSARAFTVWLDLTAGHTPLRLETPVGPGTVVVTLVGYEGGTGVAAAPATRRVIARDIVAPASCATEPAARPSSRCFSSPAPRAASAPAAPPS